MENGVLATKYTCTYYTNCVIDSSNSSYKYCDYAQYTCCGCSDPKQYGLLASSGRNRFNLSAPSTECFFGNC